jgi:hypothetical protein
MAAADAISVIKNQLLTRLEPATFQQIGEFLGDVLIPIQPKSDE